MTKRISPAVAVAATIVFFAFEPSWGGGFQRPDLTVGKVKNANAIRIGNDIYNSTGAGQTLRLKGQAGQKMVFFFCVMNDGNSSEQIRLKGTRKNRKFDITYKVDGKDVSNQVFNGKFTRYLADPGEGFYVKVIAKPTPKYRHKRASITIKARVTSEFDSQAIDCARAIFVNRP